MRRLICFLLFIVFSLAVHSRILLDSVRLDSLRLASETPALFIGYSNPDTSFILALGETKWNSDDAISVGPQNLVHLGSNTKAFAAQIAYQTIEDYGLTAELKLMETLPHNFRGLRYYHQITLDQLAKHRSGIAGLTTMPEIGQLPDFGGRAPAQRLQLARYLIQQRPKSRPGVEYAYSNAGYALLGLMSEQIADHDWENQIRDLIYDEGMIYCFGFPVDNFPDAVHGHWVEGGKLTPLGPDHFYQLPVWATPAGDLSLSFQDYFNWLDKKTTILSDPEDPSHERKMKLHFDDDLYAYGWGISRINGKKSINHDGSAGTFYVHAVIIPSEDITLSIATNSATDATIDLIYQLSEEYLKQ